MFTTLEVFATWLRAKANDDRGASLVEYALLVALIAVVCIAAVTTLGTSASTKLNSAGTSIN
jgi:pilus assembly protein Flp/PilA